MKSQTPDQIRDQITRSIGAEATLYYLALDGVTNLANRVTVLSAPEPHGFITPAGRWALYCPGNWEQRDKTIPDGCGYKPSYRFLARRIRHKKKVWIRLDDVTGFKFGW